MSSKHPMGSEIKLTHRTDMTIGKALSIFFKLQTFESASDPASSASFAHGKTFRSSSAFKICSCTRNVAK